MTLHLTKENLIATGIGLLLGTGATLAGVHFSRESVPTVKAMSNSPEVLCPLDQTPAYRAKFAFTPEENQTLATALQSQQVPGVKVVLVHGVRRGQDGMIEAEAVIQHGKNVKDRKLTFQPQPNGGWRVTEALA